MMLLLMGLVLLAADAWAAGAPVRIDGGENVVARSDIAVTTTAALIAASNGNRAALNCTTTDTVRWGDSSVTATKGQRIVANGSVEIKNTAAVYMIAESAGATVSCTEESWTSVSSGDGVFSP